MDAMMVISTIAVAMGASWTAGINLYATVAVLGLMHRYADGFTLPGDLSVLGSHWVIWPALGMYTIEFFADKIPAVDTAWDAIHTFIRIPAGALLAAGALGGVPLELQMFAGLIGGSLALGSHSVKATTRILAHSTGTSPVVSPVVSFLEDVVVVGFMGIVAFSPVLAIFLLLLMLVGAFFFLKGCFNVTRKVFRSLFGRRSAAPPGGGMVATAA